LVADKFGRFLHDRRQIFAGRFYWQTKLANFIVRLTSAWHLLLTCALEVI